MTQHNADSQRTANSKNPARKGAEPRDKNKQQLSDEALKNVVGGLNPQPLPPGAAQD